MRVDLALRQPPLPRSGATVQQLRQVVVRPMCPPHHRVTSICGSQVSAAGSGQTRPRARSRSILRSPVPPVLVGLIITIAVLAAGSWIGSSRHAADHRSPTIPKPGTASLPYAVAEMVRDGDGLRIEIQGTPGATVVLIANQDADQHHHPRQERQGLGGRHGDRGCADPRNRRARGTAGTHQHHPRPSLLRSHPPQLPLPPPPSTVTPTMTPSIETLPVTATATPTWPPSRLQDHRRKNPLAHPTEPSATRRRVDCEAGHVSPPVLHLVTDAGDRIAVTFDGNASSNGTADLLDLLQSWISRSPSS